MVRLYETAIEPVLRASGARRVVEIGALAGETTVKLLDLLGPEGEVHVIDPAPQFDPSEHEQRFSGRYHFHRATSHEVLPTLPPADAALIDGDHNWYTVYNELGMLARTAREAEAPLPVLFLHDVGWPYGRRDLYYAPERIPEEHRQPHARQGLAPGDPGLRERGGLNAGLDNAVHEGGPRNGVMTALEDFSNEHDRRLRILTLPAHFGLAIAVEQDRLDAEPALAQALARLEEAEGMREQAELAESVRVASLARAASTPTAGEGRVARRYLGVVKAALLDQHYLENEVRLDYLHRCARNGTRPDMMKLRDPRMWMTTHLRRLERERETGVPVRSLGDRPIYPYTTVGRAGLDHLEGCLEVIAAEAVGGDLAACGVWRGGTAILMRAFLDAYELDGPTVWVADSFTGPAEGTDSPAKKRRRPFSNLVADLNQVRRGFDRFGLFDERVRFLQGPYAETVPEAPIEQLALLHLGDDDEAGVAAALELLYDRLAPGGFVVVEHHGAEGARAAVDRFRRERGLEGSVERVGWGGASWRKQAAESPAATQPPQVAAAGRAVIPAAAREGAPDLSVVVVFYEMKREAARTLHSLSRSYQQGVDDLDYEVIVVENGSSSEQHLDEKLVESFGPEFRYLDLESEATPSPAHALNRGIEASRGESLALMIDGAHVLTPGVLRYGMLGLRTYEPAIVTTHQCYLGPGQQGEAIGSGYDQDYEDRLFERIDWPADGYRLFEIGNFIGDRDWFDGLWESNCLFVPRGLLEQVGALDETFSMPGGGYANLDLFERLGATPGLTVAGLLGEASFHQLHGGTTTNQPDIHERHSRLMSYREHYEGLRKRPFRGPGKPRHFVGSVGGAALRTRPRWMEAKAFRDVQKARADGVPEKAAPIPEQLQSQFTDAFWRSLAWRDLTWLGERVERAPTDLVAYQELVEEIRPEWVVCVGGTPGEASFFASICDMLGAGRVLLVGGEEAEGDSEHDRIAHVSGEPGAVATQRQVLETVGEEPNALLVIAPAPAGQVVAAFEAYSPLVGVGSYAIVEGTVLNGRPVMPEYGAGPTEAIQVILKDRHDFAPDNRPERFGLTFNPRGFLRRVE